MAKRVIVKPGDVFYVTIKGKYRRYFQYIEKDDNCLGGDLFKVFKSSYDLNSSQTVEDVLNDEVAFYSHSSIGIGVRMGFWEKFSKGELSRQCEWKNVIFGYETDEVTRSIWSDMTHEKIEGIWHIYTPNGYFKQFVTQPNIEIEAGALYPEISMVSRIESGVDMSMLMRNRDVRPFPFRSEPFSYAENFAVRRVDGEPSVHYFKFIGEEKVEEIIITEGIVTVLNQTNQSQNGFSFIRSSLKDFEWTSPVLEYEYKSARCGKLNAYVINLKSVRDRIRIYCIENYFERRKQYKSAELQIEPVMRGFRLQLKLKEKKTEEFICTKPFTVEIMMQNRDFWSMALNAVTYDRERVSILGVSVSFKDQKQTGAYRDFEAEGFKF